MCGRPDTDPPRLAAIPGFGERLWRHRTLELPRPDFRCPTLDAAQRLSSGSPSASLSPRPRGLTERNGQ